MTAAVLELNSIHAAYLKKDILKGVSLTLRAGEIVALVGENGSGKSTTLKVIAGLVHLSQGSVCFHGHDMKGLGVAERQRLGIGYLMQGARVFPNLTVQENFDLSAAEGRNAGPGPARLGDRFSVLRARARDRAGLLSGGQRQMLALELVLAQQPELLLLDEPTGALSGEHALQMLHQIRDFVASQAAAVLLVEHATTAHDFATRSLHLINGAIEA